MAAADWSDPEHALRAALTVVRAPLPQTLARVSEAIGELLPHRALAMITGDCPQHPLRTHGEAWLCERVTGAELSRLAGTLRAGRPWFGRAVVAGSARPVLAVAAVPPSSAGSVLAVLPADGGPPPEERRQRLVQQVWDLAMAHVMDLLNEAVPVQLAERRLASGERARAVAEFSGAQAATLTGLLGVLRSPALGDAAARRVAAEQAVSALLELRTAGQRQAPHEEPAGEAFARLAESLRLLTRYRGVTLELAAPGRVRQPLAAEVAAAARATVRGAVLAMLEQSAVRRIRVGWDVTETELRVTVRDDGPGSIAPDALAVHRLAERLATLRGTLRLDAVAGWGTVVGATVPFATPAPTVLPSLHALNPRELEVLERLALGRRNRQIAEELHISLHTVKFHVANILSKLEVSSRGEAAAVARAASLPPQVTGDPRLPAGQPR
jgi:DNA-binding CsgD family transcriptional regulator